MSIAALRRIQLGRETVPGTAVAATIKAMGFQLGMSLHDRVITQPEDHHGSLAAAHRHYTQSQEWTDELSGNPTFEDILYPLAMAIRGNVTPTTPVGATAARLWTFTPDLVTPNTPDTFTLEFGDNAQAYEVEHVFATSLELSAALGDPWEISAELIGRQVTPTTFTPALPDRDVRTPVCPLTRLYVDDGGGTIGTTQIMTTLLDWTWSLPEHFNAKRYQDGTLYFTSHGELPMAPELTLTCEHNAQIVALRGKYVDGIRQLVRIQATGEEVEAGFPRLVTIDGSYLITEFSGFDEADGRTTVELTLRGEYDPDYAKLFEVSAQSGVNSL
ncbi:MAG: hypothetical protein GEU73_06090 [Chloroflexi bacterium]|nr:hypothetical protein [Chloroflexota bacterium]